jgi:nitric oxide reductase subunit B
MNTSLNHHPAAAMAAPEVHHGYYRKHWLTLIAVLIVTFSLLGYYGREVYRRRRRFRTGCHGRRQGALTRRSILDGQTAWQSVGGMQLGSIWGHGAYQAPDWTADWLHRELTAWLDLAASGARQGLCRAGRRRPGRAARRLKAEYRGNTFDAATARHGVDLRAGHCARRPVLRRAVQRRPALQKSREHFAMKENTLPSAERRAQMAGFFFWTAWAAATERPADVGGTAHLHQQLAARAADRQQPTARTWSGRS